MKSVITRKFIALQENLLSFTSTSSSTAYETSRSSRWLKAVALFCTRAGCDQLHVECLQDYSINIFLRQQWHDPRLTFPPNSTFNSTLTLDARFVDLIWVPDIFLFNEVSAGEFHRVPAPNTRLTLDPDGTVFVSHRCVHGSMTFTLEELKYYFV